MTAYVLAVVAGVCGFAGGLFAFKVKSRWCPRCGRTTLAERPAAVPVSSVGRRVPL